MKVYMPSARNLPVEFPQAYDELVRLSPQGSIFAHRWWLEAVALGQYEILEVRKGNDFLAAWPLVYESKGKFKHFLMPPLTQKLGIIFAPLTGKDAEIQARQQSLTKELICKLGEYQTLYQNFHERYEDWLPFYWSKFSQTTRYTYLLQYPGDKNELWSNMRSHHRRDIRKTERLGIQICDDMEIDQFVSLNRKTFIRQGIEPPVSDDLIYRVDRACLDNAGRKIFSGVDPQGRVHAAVYIAWGDGTAYYLMGGSEPDLRHSGAQLLALWHAVQFARSVAQRFDFEGSMLPQIERVFRGFGAKLTPYFAISKTPPLPTSLRSFLKASAKHRWENLRRMIASLRPAKR